MEKSNYPVTPAIRLLRQKKVAFEPRLYDYKDHGGTRVAALSLDLPEHAVIKTIVMENDERKPLIVLMHGDHEVSTKELARTLAVKSVSPCDEAMVQKHTGYMVGGVSPFGTRKAMPVYVEKTIFDLPLIHINGGKRGFLVSIAPQILRIILPVEEVEVAIASH